MFNDLRQKDIFWIGPIIILLIAILPMPIGYYTLSRIVVCAGAVYFTYMFYKKKDIPKTWMFGFFAILYNPFLPIYLHSKFIWIVINIVTIILFWMNKKDV